MKATFFDSRIARVTALTLLFALGLGIRLFDLTDPPLDFHPTRQLLSALKARGMYYQALTDAPAEQRDFAIQQWKFRASVEPEFFERVVALTYRVTGEQLWVARLYSSLFWLAGGFFLYLLARDLVSTDGALASLAFYLLLPYSVIASRSFQPDPLMVMLIILFWWAVYKWSLTLNPARTERTLGRSPKRTEGKGEAEVTANGAKPESNLRDLRALRGSNAWLFAILAGLFGGLAIFVKFVAAFFVIGGGLGAALGRESLRETMRRPQVYVMSALGILPGAAYLIYGVWGAGFLGQQFGGRFIPSLFLSPSYYLGWIGMLENVTGIAWLTAGLLGLFFLRDRVGLRFLLGLWAGYALFGLYFNYHISSHDYYSLPLIPIVGLSLAPLADVLFAKLAELTATRWTRVLASCVLLFGLSASTLAVRASLKAVDYRPQAEALVEVGKLVQDLSVAGLTQDYGARLSYWGWKNLTSWPTSGDLIYHEDLRGAQSDFDQRFAEISTRDVFLVTDFDDLNRQPLLREKLNTCKILSQGDGYVLFDLRQPVTP